ncbi:membrane protein [Gordonia phage Finkle]|uniref:Membrane protein n=1 Tax=Gordonia phage Finkle TaxID=2926099 RepID=A0A9E7NHH9_9CAUD|nr:membrane protein [Gordonia phage Finkle]UTN92935.1 membrane protein [Gordonia phage Finkle]
MKKIGFAAIAAGVLVVALSGCSEGDDYWKDAAADACRKSVESKMPYAAVKDVSVEKSGDNFSVSGTAEQWDDLAGSMRPYSFTCDAEMDGSEVVGRATIDITSGR